jgi:hypothetical protein
MKTEQPSSNRLWVEQEFGGVSLGDRRLEQTLLDTATAIAEQPDASHPQRFDWNELRCFYRLVDADRAQPHLLQDTHRQRTRQRMTACATRVLVIHDTTALEFTRHAALHPALGPIGNGDAVGWLQHNSLAFDPEGQQLLGLSAQQLVVRQAAPVGETRTQRDRRPQKESRLWLDGIRGVGQVPAGCRWIDVLDRGGDYLDAMHWSQQLGHEFIVRVCQDRHLTRALTDPKTGEETDEAAKLHATMRTIAAQTTRVVTVASRGGRPAREVVTQVGYVAVRLQPSRWSQTVRSQAVTLVRVWEAGVDEARAAARVSRQAAKDAGQRLHEAQAVLAALPNRTTAVVRLAAQTAVAEAQTAALATQALAKERTAHAATYLDWWLATNCPVSDVTAALQVVSDYEWRWPVAEEYHKVQKTGLRLEQQRFETGPRMLAAMAILAVVAVRLLQLRYCRDAQPEADASQVATVAEITMVAQATNYRGGAMTVKRFVDGVARLGGYLGRTSDGPPGWQSLWRGYQRLTDLLLGAELEREATKAASRLPNLPSSG